MIKKFISILLALILVLGLMPTAASAATNTNLTFSDMPDNWSTEALQSAVANGLLVGYNGKIMPNSPLTRAQMATIAVLAFGAINQGDISEYTDVNNTHWFASNMAKAYKMGIMQGYDGKMHPDKNITREEAFVVLAKALKLEPVTVINKTFDDEDQISDWAKVYVYALVNANYIQGSNNKLNPKSNISRAEFAQLMHNLIKQYIKAEGEYTEIADGNIMVNVPEVTLKNITINGDLIVGDGIGDGNFTLDNVTVKGKLLARGGGVHSIIIIGGGIEGKIDIAKVDGNIRVSVEGGANVNNIVIDDGKDDVIIEGTVGTVEITASEVPVVFQNATVDKIEVVSSGTANITLANSATVTDVVINSSAYGTTLNTEGEVKTVETSAANTSISGTGTVSTVTAKEGANNTAVTTPNTKINNNGASGVTAGGGKEVLQSESVTNNNQGTDVVATGNVINVTKNKGYDTIQEAFEEVENNNTIQLMEDILLDTGISIDKDIILDLNGKKITSNWNANDEGNANAIAITIRGITTVKNGTIVTNNGAGGIQADGASAELTLENLTIDQNGLNSKNNYNSTAVMATNGAKITINSGDYSAETDGVLVKSTGGTVIINDGTFTAGRSAAHNDAWGDATHSITINGGTFNAVTTAYTGSDSYALFSEGENAAATVNDGIFNGEVSSEYAYMIINGGTFNKTIFQGGDHQDYYELKGGTFVDNIRGSLSGQTVIPEGYYSIMSGQSYVVLKGTADTSWYANPSATSFMIGNAEELVGLAQLVNDGNNFSNKTIILSNDIDLKDITWIPIGNGSKPFKGNFDGNQKKISNLNIERNTNYNGLFGKSQNGRLENVTLENVSILINTPDATNYAYTGSLAGQAQFVNNVIVTGSINIEVTGGGRYIGGIVGSLYNGSMSGSKIINSDGIGSISGKYDIGGLAGYVYYGTSITDSTVKNMEINSYLGVGGVSGRIQSENKNAQFLLENINIENTKLGNLYESIESYPVGGFLGYPYLGITVTIKDSNLTDVTIESNHLDNGLFYGLYQNTEDYGKVILENVNFFGNSTTESGEFDYLRNAK